MQGARTLVLVRPAPLAIGWPLLVGVAAVSAAAPLWSSELLPFQDAPQHLAVIRALADHGSPAFARWFEVDLLRTQYLGFYLPAAALAKLFGADVACRILLSLIAFAFPLSLSALLDAFGRDRRLAVFAPAVFHSFNLYMGFFSFVASVPAAIALVALTERQLEDPSRRRGFWLAGGAAALLWLHPSALAFALASALVLALTSRRARRAALLPYLPATLLLAGWAVAAARARDGIGQAAHTAPRWLPLQTRIFDLLHFTDVLSSHVDERCTALLGILFVTAVMLSPLPRGARFWRLPLLALITLAAYFAAPFDAGYVGYIEQRALPFFFLLVIASPLLAQTRAVSLLCAGAVVVQVAYGVRLASSYRAFDAEAEVPSLRTVLASAEPGRRLLALIPDQHSEVMHFRPYIHFGMYYQLRRGGRARYNFAETPWPPLRFRRGTEPPRMPLGWEWHPEWVDLPRDARDEDYLLLRAPAAEPGAPFRLRIAAGRWRLYERSP